MFDTHCHLNFSAFEERVDQVVKGAQDVGVDLIMVPGTDVISSKKAVEVSQKYNNVYAAVGIHPHHIYGYLTNNTSQSDIREIEKLLSYPKVLAVGEVGMDRHIYKKTKYQDYAVEQQFVDLQKRLLKEQIILAIEHKKSLIFHNREAKNDFLDVVSEFAGDISGKSVFHCCEPDQELLDFAKNHKVFIGVDGDIFYRKDKQKFIKQIPLNMLVLETDSPFLAPDRKFPNEPKNIAYIAKFIANILEIDKEEVAKNTTSNAYRLFGI